MGNMWDEMGGGIGGDGGEIGGGGGGGGGEHTRMTQRTSGR